MSLNQKPQKQAAQPKVAVAKRKAVSHEDYEELKKKPVNQKIEKLIEIYPEEIRHIARLVVEKSGLEDNDLLLADLVLDAAKTKHLYTVFQHVLNQSSNYSKIDKSLKDLEEKVSAMPQNHEESLKYFKAIYKETKPTPKPEPSQRKRWKRWLTSPPGIAASVIALLMFLILLIVIFK